MIRLTWRQFRLQALIAAGGLIALAIALVLTHSHIADLYVSNVRTCAARNNCDTAITAFLNTDRALQSWLNLLVVVVPALIGLFWGAPLIAREIESGTLRLVWTQSITRARWVIVKLAMLGTATMATAGVLTWMVTRWFAEFDRVGMDRFASFDERNVVPIGHAAFAFVLGVTFGAVLRRTLPALGATLVSFVAVRLSFNTLLRPHLIGPLRRIVALDSGGMGFGSADGGPMTLQPDGPRMPNAWVHSIDIVDRAGRLLPADAVSKVCPQLAIPGPPPGARGGGEVRGQVPDEALQSMRTCVAKLSATYHEVIQYQPAGRYWTFQWLELGIYVAVAAGLAGFCFWWVRRRLS